MLGILVAELQAAPHDRGIGAPLTRVKRADRCRCSLDGDELGASGGTNTDLTVANGLVGHGVLTEVVSDHVSSDFDRVPVLSRVDLADGADHLWHDDRVTEVRLDRLGLLTVRCFLHRLDKLLDEAVVAGLNAAAETSALASAEHVDDILRVEREELLKLDTSVNLLSECFFLGGLRGLGSGKSFGDGGHI